MDQPCKKPFVSTTKIEQRCVRLEKVCQSTVRRRAARREPKAATKVARLEEKLDSLVSLIRANPNAMNSVADAPATGSPEPFVRTPESSAASTSHTSVSNPSADFSPGVSLKDCLAQSNSVTRSGLLHPCPLALRALDHNQGLPNFDSSKLSHEEADDALLLFRSHMLAHYPIITIVRGVNASGLRAQSPFLWLCIMAVSLKSSLKQRSLGLEIRRTMAHRLIVEGERNIDLLQGLLVYSGWFVSTKRHP